MEALQTPGAEALVVAAIAVCRGRRAGAATPAKASFLRAGRGGKTNVQRKRGKAQPEGTLEEHFRLEVGNITLTSNIIIPIAGDYTSIHKMRSGLSSSAEKEMRKKSTPEK